MSDIIYIYITYNYSKIPSNKQLSRGNIRLRILLYNISYYTMRATSMMMMMMTVPRRSVDVILLYGLNSCKRLNGKLIFEIRSILFHRLISTTRKDLNVKISLFKIYKRRTISVHPSAAVARPRSDKNILSTQSRNYSYIKIML